MWTLDNFYQSREWAAFREVVIHERTKEDGLIYDEITGLPILRRYDIILHHVKELTDENVNDVTVSLNPENIQVVSHRTHNKMRPMGISTFFIEAVAKAVEGIVPSPENVEWAERMIAKGRENHAIATRERWEKRRAKHNK